MGMTITHTLDNGILTVSLGGRIDTTNAAEAEEKALAAVSQSGASKLILDMSELEYISSAGLRVLMKLRKLSDEPPQMINVSSQIYDILETTGFTELFEVSKKKREISVDGCEIIGKGFYGTVYRIDDETVVKVYESADSLAMIQNEKRLAKTALIAGVPTAISYDIVKVGNSYGSVFELLNARTLNDVLREDTSRVVEITKQYAQFLKLVNSQTVPEGRLNSSKQQFLGYLERIKDCLSSDMYERLKMLLDSVPEQHNVIHGDAQMKNIMVVDNDPMLIDMDTLSEGHPIFDLQSVYVTYFAFGEDYHQNSMEFLGMPHEVVEQVWQNFIGFYFDTEDDARITELRDKITIAGCVRFLFLININPDYQRELYDIRTRHTLERLEKLIYKYDTLLFD
ncbi:anti-sigma factor antagonist [Ruminococcus sp. NK3A76]|uniref:anti-sigma factor antagonist n=1 Tax=Ruminococcus sp. NK3A76 TaxID=877411 RepID=UPI00068BC5C7|nr:anti-sigma factor antagonist [Ruminococcus sp. NK3A76]